MISLALALAILGGCGGSQSGVPSRQVERETRALFDTLAIMELTAQPELATRLGLPEDSIEQTLSGSVGDRSQAAFERLRLRRIELLRLLEQMTLAPAQSTLRRHQEAVLRTYDQTVSIGRFGHGRVFPGNAYPYAIDHRSGGWIDLPDLLITSQPVASLADAEDFVRRVAGLASVIEDERLRLIADARAGIMPPDVILAAMQARIAAELAVPVGEHRLLIALEDLMSGLEDAPPGERIEMARHLTVTLERRVRPAQEKLAATLAELQQQAGSAAGVWALPDGDAYYDALIGLHLGSELSAESLHREGLAEVDALRARLDSALTAAGLAEGSVGERLARLSAREDQSFAPRDDPDPSPADMPDSDARGADALIAAIEADIETARRGFAAWIARQPERALLVQPVGTGLDAVPGGAYYLPPAADGSRAGLFQIDVSDLSAWPRFALPALVAHETVPGHHTEAVFAMELADMPLIRQLIWNTGYGEGWATYAEYLALEAGVFAEQPLAEIGLLQSLLLRAARQVADTGIHRLRWSRAEAIDYLVTTTGLSERVAAAEVDRYIVWPAQALAYTAGAKEIAAIRRRAEAVLGDRFDVAAFHHTLLAGGPRPLEQVETEMERWYEAQMR